MAKIVQETRYELVAGELLELARLKGRERACRGGGCRFKARAPLRAAALREWPQGRDAASAAAP